MMMMMMIIIIITIIIIPLVSGNVYFEWAGSNLMMGHPGNCPGRQPIRGA
jgi:hypothetical protein